MSTVILRIFRCAFGLLLNLVYLVASGVPRNEKLWVFGAWNGRKFLDNPKYVYLRTLEHVPGINPVWVTKDAALARSLRHSGYPAVFAYSPRGIWTQLRAGVVVFTHSVEWDLCAPLIAARVKRVQTWHGMPIKKIGYDDHSGTSRERARLIAKLFPFRDDKVDLFIAASSADKEKYASAFNVASHSVVISGYPRNDALVRSMKSGAERTTRKVIYMPTLRGASGTEFNLFADTYFDFGKADIFCRNLDIELVIKLHPVQRFRQVDLNEISRCERIRAWKDSSDIYELIGSFDLLITDFSGIYFDFLISGRPIVMAPLDMAEYLRKDRDLYYSYDELCPDAPCNDWAEVFDRIGTSLEENWAPGTRYVELQKRFHVFTDDRSSERVIDEIGRLTNLYASATSRARKFQN